MYESFSLWQLHCFSDASKDAFAAVVYLRTERESEVITNRLLAKVRVAPLEREKLTTAKLTPEEKEKLTIPRVELMAAFITVRLLEHGPCSCTNFRKSTSHRPDRFKVRTSLVDEVKHSSDIRT